MQALLDNVTTPELRGNIIVILGGYAEHVEELFSVNPGDHSPTHYPPLTTHYPPLITHSLTHLTLSLTTHHSPTHYPPLITHSLTHLTLTHLTPHSPTHYPPLTTHLPHPLTYLTHSLPTHCVDAGLRSRFDKKVCTYV